MRNNFKCVCLLVGIGVCSPGYAQEGGGAEAVVAPEPVVVVPEESAPAVQEGARLSPEEQRQFQEFRELQKNRHRDNRAFHGHESLYLMRGAWSLINLGGSSDDLDIEGETKSFQSAFAFTYLKHTGNDLWIGPYLEHGYSSSKTEDATDSSRQWKPGLEFRKVFSTKGNGYVSLYSRLGWAFYQENYEDDDTNLSGSYNGFNYGGGLSIGNRVGENDTYILESNFDISRGSFSGELDLTTADVDYKADITRFYFGISIGKLF